MASNHSTVGPSARGGGKSGLIGLAIGGLGLAFVVYRVIARWQDVTETVREGDLALVDAAVPVGFIGMLVIGMNWVFVLARFHKDPDRGWVVPIIVGQLGKYVPGGIWPIVGRAEMARRAAT